MITDEERQARLRAIPKVDEVLAWLEPGEGPSRLLKAAVREVLADRRETLLQGEQLAPGDLERGALLPLIRQRLAEKLQPRLRPVINATGVVIHTNLGRSLLPRSALEGLLQAAARYSNLELDLKTGKRGSRYSLVEDLLCELTGAEAALVVNNNAAAVLLVLETLAKGKEVIVSRGQLVEIGGSFRIPEVMARSGARLVEVGATNRTHLRDYERAIGEQTALLLKVHTSNYRMIGFTSEVELPALVALGTRFGLPVMEDLGSGCLLDLSRFGLPREPTVREVVGAGVDVVTFSGDKLLGGPQAGIILGRRELVAAIKKNPLNRALRIDKFTLAALEAILRLYFDEEEALRTIPTLAMLTGPVAAVEGRARRLIGRIRKPLAGRCTVSMLPTEARVGGGALPEQGPPSRAVALAPHDRSVTQLERELRQASLPVLGRIEAERLLLDLRTVADDEVAALAEVLQEIFGLKGE